MKNLKTLFVPVALAVAAIPVAGAAVEAGPETDFPITVPDGWIIDRQTGGHLPKTVLVPAGESFESSAVSITIVQIEGFGVMMSPQQAIDGARERLAKSCPASKVSESRSSGKGPGERSFARLDCSAPARKATPMAVFAAANREQASVRLTSIAYKRSPSPADTSFALGYLGEAGS
jgi:hypothetical protein